MSGYVAMRLADVEDLIRQWNDFAISPTHLIVGDFSYECLPSVGQAKIVTDTASCPELLLELIGGSHASTR